MAEIRDIRVVLVNPSHPGNVGAAARAMKNMGLSQLLLVAPQEFPDPRAIWRAAGAKDLVEQARVCDTLEEAIADCQYVVGTSARERRIPWPCVEPREMAEQIYRQPGASKIAVLFGREDSGLTNEELQRCNLHVNVPTHEGYRSLNLAMAVQIICYELRIRALADHDRPQQPMDEWDEPLASSEDVERFYEHLFSTLARIDFYDPENPKQLETRLRRLFNRTQLDKMELNILRGILAEVEKKTR
ncbi:MAG: RNA methyltransferase [Pseudomonadales bacterium]